MVMDNNLPKLIIIIIIIIIINDKVIDSTARRAPPLHVLGPSPVPGIP